MRTKRKSPHIGGHLDELLAEDGMLDDVTAVALKRVIAWQIEQAMKVQGVTKTSLAQRMNTSRAAVNRLLDGQDPSMTLETLARAARVLGRTVDLHLRPT